MNCYDLSLLEDPIRRFWVEGLLRPFGKYGSNPAQGLLLLVDPTRIGHGLAFGH